MSRPLLHPNLEHVTVAGILHALADPVRLTIVRELLHAADGMNCTETMGRVGGPMPKSTCSQHFQILREAGLIRSERKGTELTSRLRLDELSTRFPGLVESILDAYERESAGRRSRPGKRLPTA